MDQPELRGAVQNTIELAVPPETAFDYLTDLHREHEWNPQLREVQQLTPGPIGLGTRYQVRFGRGVEPALVETTSFDRPTSWSAVSSSPTLTVHLQGTVTPTPQGCAAASVPDCGRTVPCGCSPRRCA